MTSIVNQKLTTLSDFEKAIDSLPYPDGPKNPVDVCEKDYSTKSEYYLALSRTFEGYEERLALYNQQMEDRKNEIQNIKNAFKEFCMELFLHEDMSMEVKSKFYDHIADQNEDYLYEIYQYLSHMSKIANEIFIDGKKSSTS